MDVNKSIFIEGQSAPHRWEEAQSWLQRYDHPLWKRLENYAEGAGHGGMDFFVVNAFIQAIKNAATVPIDVYDSAAWSVITPLSETSIAQNGSPQDFPDFTNGTWKTKPDIFALDDRY